jgi:tetratricopeptide (TPR) repeat protein
LIFIVGIVQGQSPKDFNWYNGETYRLYELQQWDELVKVGDDALEAGFDFFYLQLRMGIAYYEMEKYRTAQSYFNNALSFNNSDPLTLEYLYYSYWFSGRNSDASVFYKKHKDILVKRKVATPNLFVKSLYTEGGVKVNSESDEYIDPIRFYHIGLEHQLSSRLNIYHGYSRLTQKFTEFIDGNSSGQGPPQLIGIDYTYAQHEYYIKGTLAIAQGLQLIPAYHIQSVKGIGDVFDNKAFHIGVKKNLGKLDLYTGYGQSAINYNNQTQWTGSVTFYPSGNINLYLQSNITYHKEKGEEGNAIFYEKVGFKAAGKMWLELNAAFGTMRNIQELDGFYVLNLPDRISSRYGVHAIFPVNNHFKISGGVTIENREALETLLEYQLYTGFMSIQYNL